MDQELREFAQRIVRLVVDQPEAVEIGVSPVDGGYALSIRVAPGEVGMVIGRQGRTIQAIRQLLTAYGAKMHQRINLEIDEPGNPHYED
jgi:uncharacterized protein